MNTLEYISSGVLEAYVMGIASDTEIQEIEQLAAQYPEIQAAINEQQIALEHLATAQAVPPPPASKNNIWAAIQSESNTQKETPKIDIASGAQPTLKKDKGWQQYGMAASVALLVAAGASNIWMQKQQAKMSAEIAAMTQKQNELLAENKVALLKVQQAEQALAVMTLPKLKKIQLNGVGTHTAHSAMLYWDGATGEVYVDMHSMPAAPNGKAYQLWAIVDGKPVDAGMYNAKGGESLLQMKTFAKAEMFAVTIEKIGGSPTPTMEQMVVAGKTS